MCVLPPRLQEGPHGLRCQGEGHQLAQGSYASEYVDSRICSTASNRIPISTVRYVPLCSRAIGIGERHSDLAHSKALQQRM